ncbi:MAG: FRG domain-containing protein [Proteobacteria bacterium]|nr:MAG: FRG domain-containing protein [Pseudomonadota bacterium]
MTKREISSLDLKLKVTHDYFANGGIQQIWEIDLLEDLKKVKNGSDGKVDPETISSKVNAFMLSLLAAEMVPPFYAPDHIGEYNTIIQKATSFDQIQIDTNDQFDHIYKVYNCKSDYIFRGQREAKWRLYSTLQRHWILKGLGEKFESYQALLESLVAKGRSVYRDEYIKLLGEIHDDADNDIAVLSFLQHHGCPTSLLDWTYRFENALFFAVDGAEPTTSKKEIDNYVSVYFIKESGFERGGMRTLLYESIDGTQEFALNLSIDRFTDNEKVRTEMKGHFKGRNAIDTSRIKGSGMIAFMLRINHMINFRATYFSDNGPDDIIFSLNNSENIKSQAGVFTWNADPTKPFEMVVSEQNNLTDNKSEDEARSIQNVVCECLNINKALIPYVQRVLEADGVKRDLLYPTPERNTLHIFEDCTM